VGLNRILVVDDEKDILELVRTILVGNGFEVITAGTGEEGLKLAVSGKPDLIILDVVMPGLSGLEVCRLLKGKKSMAGISILMMSVLNREIDRKNVTDAGADEYIIKPFRAAHLLSTVDRLLNKQE